MAALEAQPPAVRAGVMGDLAGAQLICLSEDIAREALEAGFSSGQLIRLPNGVDSRAVARTLPVRAVDDDRPTILFAGRLDEQKGIDVLLLAFAELRAERKVNLLVAGTGPLLDELRGLARELRVSSSVHFLGRRHDVWGLLRSATICCLPSRGEGMSNTLLEAMAAGTAVVASRIPANEEVLGGEEAGLLVALDDVEELKTVLARLLDDRGLRERLTKAAQKRVRNLYDLEVVAAAHADLFAGLRPGPRPGRIRITGRFLRARADDLRRGLRHFVAFPRRPAERRPGGK
jgi:glycosyltransferase involved in cell wall biosynthesis